MWKKLIYSSHSVHWGINPPLKNTNPPSFLTRALLPPLNLQTVQAPFLGNPSPIYRFFMTHP